MTTLSQLIATATSDNAVSNLLASNVAGIYFAKSYMELDGTTDDYSSLYALINTTINGDNAEIWFAEGTCYLGSSITIPSNIKLVFLNGAMLKPESGKVITGSWAIISAGLHKIFDLSLSGSSGIAGTWNVAEWYPEWFGAIGDGSTDDSTEFQYLIDILASGGTIKLQSKTYIINTKLTITKSADGEYPLRICGNGHNSVLKTTSDIVILEITNTGTPPVNTRSWEICDLRFEDGKTHIYGYYAAYGLIHNCLFDGYSTTSAPKVHLYGCYNIPINNNIFYENDGTDVCIKCEYSDYIIINGNTIGENIGTGIYVVGNTNINITGNTINDFADTGIRIDYASKCVISGNNIFSSRNAGTIGIYLVNDDVSNSPNNMAVNGNVVTVSTVNANAYALHIRGMDYCTVVGNVFVGKILKVESYTTGTGTNNRIAFNVISVTTVSYIAGNTFYENEGYITTNSSLSGSVTWDPGSLNDGAGETSASITVTGAALGDFAICSAPYDLQGVTCNAYVDNANSVKIRLQNETTGVVDFASGTWKVRVIKS